MTTKEIKDSLLAAMLHTPAETPKYNRAHVFTSIIQFAQESIPQEESFSMMYGFHLYQRILKASQFGRMGLARSFVKEAKEIPETFSHPAAQAGMKSLYHPAMAYFEYVSNQYETALEGIQASYAYIQQLYEMGLMEAILMKVEQVTNEFRVLYSMGNEEQALECATQLLQFAITGTPNERFPYSLKEVIQDEQEQEQLVKYLLDSLLFKWLNHHKMDPMPAILNMQKVLQHIQDPVYSKMAEQLAAIHQVGIENWVQQNDFLPFFHEIVPSLVKILVIHAGFIYLIQENEDMELMEDAFHQFNKTQTKIPDNIIKPLFPGAKSLIKKVH